MRSCKMRNILSALLGLTIFEFCAPEGPTCMRCQNADTIDECNLREVKCGGKEKCFLEQVVTSEQKIKFNAGCRDNRTCYLIDILGKVGRKRSNVLSKSKRDLTKCVKCCDSEPDMLGPCNAQLCGQAPLKTQTTCRVCDGVHESIAACDREAVCPPGQSCYAGTRVVGDVVRYVLGCYENLICHSIAINRVSRSIIHDQGIRICDACCAGNNCNSQDCFTLLSKMNASDYPVESSQTI